MKSVIGFNDVVFAADLPATLKVYERQAGLTEATENRFSMKKRFFSEVAVNSVVLIRSDVVVEDPRRAKEDRHSLIVDLTLGVLNGG